MYVELIEGYLDSVLVELALDRFHNVKVNCPIISALCPSTNGDLDSGRAVCTHSYEGLGILEHALVRIEDSLNDALCLFGVPQSRVAR